MPCVASRSRRRGCGTSRSMRSSKKLMRRPCSRAFSVASLVLRPIAQLPRRRAGRPEQAAKAPGRCKRVPQALECADGHASPRYPRLPGLQRPAAVQARSASARLPARTARLSDSGGSADHAGGGGSPARGGRSAARTLIGMLRAVIPARYDSTRLPGKVLLALGGKPMLQWVWERARASRADEVLVATDDARVARAAESFGAQVLMTAAAHASGTDRIAEAAWHRRWPDDDLIVNIQADEPLMPPALIDQVSELLEAQSWAHIATLASPLASLEELTDPNVIKVVTGSAGRA